MKHLKSFSSELSTNQLEANPIVLFHSPLNRTLGLTRPVCVVATVKPLNIVLVDGTRIVEALTGLLVTIVVKSTDNIVDVTSVIGTHVSTIIGVFGLLECTVLVGDFVFVSTHSIILLVVPSEASFVCRLGFGLRALIWDTFLGGAVIVIKSIGDLGTESAGDTDFVGGCGAGSEHEEDCLGEGVHDVDDLGKGVCNNEVCEGEDGALEKL